MDSDQEVVREPFEDEYDESVSSESSHIEDSKFAKSYGIELQSKSLKLSKLIKSNNVEPPSTSNNQAKLVIKTSVTTDCIYHKGTFYQKGDIVALFDQDDGQIYFAQLTGFLQDQYCEKSASVNWLVPTKLTSREFFDPSAYRIGLEDVQLRKMDCMTFVRHCPHDYYLRKFFQSDSGPEQADCGHRLARTRSKKDQAYIWTTMETCRVPTIETK